MRFFRTTYTFTILLLPPATLNTDVNHSLGLRIHSGHSPVIIKFPIPDCSLIVPDISSEYLRSIDPRNSSDTKRNACYFSPQYSYILSQL